MTGRQLNERLGKINFWLLFIGTNVTFFPQHLLGLDGMVRRIADYSPNAGWTELNFLSSVGAFIIAVQHPAVPVERVHHAAPAAGRAATTRGTRYTLEWATTSPPPVYNFDSLPPIRSERPFFDLKLRSVLRRPRHGGSPAQAAGISPRAAIAHRGTRSWPRPLPRTRGH